MCSRTVIIAAVDVLHEHFATLLRNNQCCTRAQRNARTDIVYELINHGAKVEVHDDPDGCTPLHLAAWKGNAATTAVLMDMKADLHARDRYGYTPLDRAFAQQAGVQKVIKATVEGMHALAKPDSSLLPLSTQSRMMLMRGLQLGIHGGGGTGESLPTQQTDISYILPISVIRLIVLFASPSVSAALEHSQGIWRALALLQPYHTKACHRARVRQVVEQMRAGPELMLIAATDHEHFFGIKLLIEKYGAQGTTRLGSERRTARIVGLGSQDANIRQYFEVLGRFCGIYGLHVSSMHRLSQH